LSGRFQYSGVAESPRTRAELGIAARAKRAGQRQPVAPTFPQIVEQDVAGVVALRDGKADLQRAGAIARNPIGDLARHRLPPLCREACLDASYRAMKAGAIARSRASSIRPERVT
jgi:hypothetical protein